VRVLHAARSSSNLKSLLTKGLALSLVLCFYIVILLVIQGFTGTLDYEFAAILLAGSMIFAGLVATVQKRLETMVGKALFKEKHEAYETLTEFSRAMVSILDLPTLTETILSTLKNVLNIQTVSLFLLDNEKDAYMLSSTNGTGNETLQSIRFSASDELPHYLRCSHTLLVRADLKGSPEINSSILHALDAMASEVCLPLINKDRLIGFINLGPRTGIQAYAQHERHLLTTLAQNAAVALDNAMLYTDLKRSQILMRRTDRLRSLETIAGGFAHEIRNPLTSIKTFVQLAPGRRDDAEFIDRFSEVVIEDVYRIERLIHEILDYARYREPKFVLEDLNDIVSSCLYFIEVKASTRFITIEKHLAPDLPSAMLDRQQIKQVLLNLLLNGMDAMNDRGGQLSVKTHRLNKADGTWMQIEIGDTGVGISPNNLEHIFDPFYTTKHESIDREGTGLGLTIVHQIIQEHHGYIEVESTVGAGTTFYINLRTHPLEIDASKEAKDYEKASVAHR
jgi:two-component system, NtrC family, sensor kinase